MSKNKYHKIKDGSVVAFDVDDTLVMWHLPKEYSGVTVKIPYAGYEEECIPNTYTIDFLKKMKRRGHSIIVWSAGGSDWAEAVVRALNLEDYVDVITPKLDYHVDDNKDPTDKIGRWSYISVDGYAQKQRHDGTLTGWKIE